MIRTSLPSPFGRISAGPNVGFRYVLRTLNAGVVIISAVERDSGKRLLINKKNAVSLLTNTTISRYWPINITSG